MPGGRPGRGAGALLCASHGHPLACTPPHVTSHHLPQPTRMRRPDGEVGVKDMPPGSFRMDRFCMEPTAFKVKVSGGLAAR